MSNVKRYDLACDIDPDSREVTTVIEPDGAGDWVRLDDYAALEAECEKWHQQFNCMQLQRDHHRDKAKALAAELAAIRAAEGEQDPSKILLTALRQYMHNDGSGLLAGYEYEETQRIVAAMAAELEEVRRAQVEVINSRNAHQWECERLTAELEAARKQEPFWYAVVSEGAPVIDKAIRREDVAQEYADKCSEHRTGVEVIPLYRLPPLAGKVSVPRELLERIAELYVHGDFREGVCMCGSSVDSHGLGDGHAPVDAGENYAGQVFDELRALLATPSMEVKS